jgi:hypothetical protein
MGMRAWAVTEATPRRKNAAIVMPQKGERKKTTPEAVAKPRTIQMRRRFSRSQRPADEDEPDRITDLRHCNERARLGLVDLERSLNASEKRLSVVHVRAAQIGVGRTQHHKKRRKVGRCRYDRRRVGICKSFV